MANDRNWGGVREGAGRKITAEDGKIRKMRSTRASDAEWKLIKEFAAILKDNPQKATKIMDELKNMLSQ